MQASDFFGSPVERLSAEIAGGRGGAGRYKMGFAAAVRKAVAANRDDYLECMFDLPRRVVAAIGNAEVLEANIFHDLALLDRAFAQALSGHDPYRALAQVLKG